MNEVDRLIRVVEWTQLSKSVRLVTTTETHRYFLTALVEARFGTVRGAANPRKRVRYIVEIVLRDAVGVSTVHYFAKADDAYRMIDEHAARN